MKTFLDQNDLRRLVTRIKNALFAKEDKSNKVSVIEGDPYADSSKELYPNVAAVAKVTDDMVAHIHEIMPKKISDLEDDSSFNKPLNYASDARYSELSYEAQFAHNSAVAYEADCDGIGNLIHETYAQKSDFNWKHLNTQTITADNIGAAGDEGITSIALYCIDDLEQFRELMCIVRIPKNTLNTTKGSWIAGLSANDITLPNSYDETLAGQYGLVDFDASLHNDLIIKTEFLNGKELCTTIQRDNYGDYKSYMYSTVAHVYTDNPAMAKNYKPCELKGKTTYWIVSTNLNGTAYKFPEFTEVSLWAR